MVIIYCTFYSASPVSVKLFVCCPVIELIHQNLFVLAAQQLNQELSEYGHAICECPSATHCDIVKNRHSCHCTGKLFI